MNFAPHHDVANLVVYSIAQPVFVFETEDTLICDKTLTALEDGRYYIVKAGDAHAVVQCQHGILTDSQGVTVSGSQVIARAVRLQKAGRPV